MEEEERIIMEKKESGPRLRPGLFLLSLALPVGTGLLSALLSGDIGKSYEKLVKPPFAPPGWLFGPVWLVLYLLMGYAAYRILLKKDNTPEAREGLFDYGVQLLFNFMWTILFFGFQFRLAALVDILALLGFLLFAMIRFYRVDKTAGLLLLPYFLWTSFAAVLNAAIWWLNL